MNAAIEKCIRENILRDFLIKHRAEVLDVFLTEYDEAATMEAIRKEERAEERENGLKTLITVLKSILPDFESVLAKVREQDLYADVTEEQVRRYYENE